MAVTGKQRAPDRRTARGVPGWATLVVFVVVAEAIGAASSLFADIGFANTGSGSWYERLDKPAFDPPGWAFAPVWIVLQVFVGIAGWLAWRAEPSRARTDALWLWTAQLVLSGSWAPVFFGAESARAGLAVIGLVLVLAIMTAGALEPVDRNASWLFVPYIAWVAFVTSLNTAIVLMN